MKTNLNLAMAATAGSYSVARAGDRHEHDRHEKHEKHHHAWSKDSIQLGPRPFYLVEGMDDSVLKGGDPDSIAGVFGSQEACAQAFIDELKAAGMDAEDVWVQSFNREDMLYWMNW